MTRNLKALGLALVAIFALSAIAAQGASAHKIVTTKAPTTLTGATIGKHIIVLSSSAELECNLETTGELEAEESEEFEVTPTFSECVLGEMEVEVATEGCKVRYSAKTTKDPNTGEESGTTKLVCPGGKAMKIKASGCTVEIPEQGPLHGVKFSNGGGAEPTDIKITSHEFGIKFIASGFLCSLIGISSGEHTDATTLVSTTVTGYQKGKPHVIDNQVGVHVK